MLRESLIIATLLVPTEYRIDSYNYNSRCFLCQQRVTWVVRDRDYRSLGYLDKEKTNACRKGFFLPRVHGQYIVITKNADLNVAWSSGKNLLDSTRLSKPNETYFFIEAGYYYNSNENGTMKMEINQRCEVYVGQ